MAEVCPIPESDNHWRSCTHTGMPRSERSDGFPPEFPYVNLRARGDAVPITSNQKCASAFVTLTASLSGGYVRARGHNWRVSFQVLTEKQPQP